MSEMKRNNAIQITRIVAMISIILCHIIKYYTFIPGSQFLNVVFNVGVQVFLVISGFLYGQKEISGFKLFIVKRIDRIYLPVIIVVIPVLIIYRILRLEITPVTMCAYLLNLQGLLFIDWNFFSKFINEIPSLGHLWFTTIIFICYLLIPLLQSIKSKQIKQKRVFALLVMLFVISYFCSALLGISFEYFLLFAVGYFLNYFDSINTLTKAKYFVLSLFMLFTQVLRLVFMHFYDGTSWYVSYTGVSHSVLGLWIVISIFTLNKYFPKIFDYLSNSKIINHLDKMSYFIYISHGLFFTGIFNVYECTNSLFLNTILFSIATYFVAIFICFITKLIDSILEKRSLCK